MHVKIDMVSKMRLWIEGDHLETHFNATLEDCCSCSGQVTMVNTLKIEGKLEGETNFQAWKARVLLLLEENDLKEFVESVVESPIDLQELVAHKKKEVKAKWVLLEPVKDHLISHIAKKTSAKEMYDALVGLYQNGITGRKLHLKHQLQVVKMSSEHTIVNYLMKIT
jgi:hypothetical protein